MAGEYVPFESGFEGSDYDGESAGSTQVIWAQDYAEANKLSQFYPSNGAAWWENLALYGATKAIDSHFAPAAVNKTTAGASYAGANGKTYGPGVAPGGGIPPIVWMLGLGAVAFLVLND